MLVAPTQNRIAAGVDYFTGVCKRGKYERLFQEVSVRLLEGERSRGNLVGPWNWKGYQGLRAGAIECGTRTDSSIIRISGATAEKTWLEVYPITTSVTRIDVQVTVFDGRDITEELCKVYEWAKEREGGINARPKFRLIQGTDGGITLYVGSRKSDVMGRMYDTGKKHKQIEYQGGFRGELEIHGGRAAHMSARLYDSTCRQALCAQTAVSWLHDRTGPHESFSTCLSSPLFSGSTASAAMWLPLPRRPTDCQRALQCARIQWRKNARMLVAKGYGAELLECLGLSVSASGVLELSDTFQFTPKEGN